jgi:glycine cleavage system regulatory protein
MATFTLTCIGDDRPGLVSALSAPINAHGASWERSQMSRLAGKFAGILMVAVPDDRAEALAHDLLALKDIGLLVALEQTDSPADQESVRLSLELLGADHPGIVAEISAALAEQGVGIAELTTDVHEAPMSGGMLFEVSAVLEAPPETSLHGLRTMLEALADELMVEIRLSDSGVDASGAGVPPAAGLPTTGPVADVEDEPEDHEGPAPAAETV